MGLAVVLVHLPPAQPFRGWKKVRELLSFPHLTSGLGQPGEKRGKERAGGTPVTKDFASFWTVQH
jgi:hypothetical protein